MNQIGDKVRKQWGLKDFNENLNFVDADANADAEGMI